MNKQTGFQARLEDRLKVLDMTPNKASVLAGLHPGTVRGMLSYNRSANPRRDTIEKLANVLSCSSGWLSTGKELTFSAEGTMLITDSAIDNASAMIEDEMQFQNVKLKVKTMTRITLELIRKSRGDLSRLGPGIACVLVQESDKYDL